MFDRMVSGFAQSAGVSVGSAERLLHFYYQSLFKISKPTYGASFLRKQESSDLTSPNPKGIGFLLSQE